GGRQIVRGQPRADPQNRPGRQGPATGEVRGQGRPMTEIEFRAWPKLARLRRPFVITEKIDGTNAAIGFQEVEESVDNACCYLIGHGLPLTAVYAQSRNRIITPEQDNHGFARWVHDNAFALFEVLGLGLHFGEWWGSGIQRGYGLPKGEKRFSLFNT